MLLVVKYEDIPVTKGTLFHRGVPNENLVGLNTVWLQKFDQLQSSAGAAVNIEFWNPGRITAVVCMSHYLLYTP
jgi:hypothetical protein